MKTYLIWILAILPFVAIGQKGQPDLDNLEAEVHGDTVILRDILAYRNCGALYTMQLTNFTGNTFRWIQKDFGSTAYCNCYFNLNVTIDSLPPGDYFAYTYYTHPGSNSLTYVGTISFSISTTNSYVSPSVFSQEQSECLSVGIDTNTSLTYSKIEVYPNPVKTSITVTTDMRGEKLISIYDLVGSCVLRMSTDMNEILIDLKDLPSKMYIMSLQNKENAVHYKIIKN